MAKVKFLKTAFWAIVYALVFANTSLADTLCVPYHYLTIQEALCASNPGDTIEVASGTYRLFSGNIVIVQKSITLRSAYGAKKTVIEGRGNTPVITFMAGSHSVIDGFTITSIDDMDRTVLKGGGIYCSRSSSPYIINSIIIGNNAVFGGGVYCDSSSAPVIANNIISGNNAIEFGGGILSFRASPNIADNKIVENEASNAGGGIFCCRDSSRISNNIIWKNKARSGGGISCDRSSCTIVNDTITGNAAICGGGLFFEGGTLRIMNTILWDNEDDLYSAWFSPASRPDHSDIGDGDFRGVNGNIVADPLFVDPGNGDFRLSPDSPCKDAGNRDPVYNDPDGSRNDMGSYGGPKANIGAYQ